jgi:hypothetical protein
LLVESSWLATDKIVAGAVGQPVLALTLKAEVSTMEMTALSFTLYGTAKDPDFSTVKLYEDTDNNLIFSPMNDLVLHEGLFDAGSVTFEFEPARAVSSGAPNKDTLFLVVDVSPTAREGRTCFIRVIDCQVVKGIATIVPLKPQFSYIGDAESKIIIDGGFMDWELLNVTTHVDTDKTPVANPNVDINTYRIAVDDNHLSFYFDVRGEMLAGTQIPLKPRYVYPVEKPPEVVDTDGDGLPDELELQHATNPNDPDTDKDNVPDGEETDWNRDSDGDGLINARDLDSDNDLGMPDNASNSWWDVGRDDVDEDDNGNNIKDDEEGVIAVTAVGLISVKVILPKLLAEDTAYIFFDTDNDVETGYRVFGSRTDDEGEREYRRDNHSPDSEDRMDATGVRADDNAWDTEDTRSASENSQREFSRISTKSRRDFGADYMIQIKGKGQRIMSSMYYEYGGGEEGDWNWTPIGEVSSAIDYARLETQIPFEKLNLTDGSVSVYFCVHNWDNSSVDYSEYAVMKRGVGEEAREDGGNGIAEWNKNNADAGNIESGISTTSYANAADSNDSASEQYSEEALIEVEEEDVESRTRTFTATVQGYVNLTGGGHPPEGWQVTINVTDLSGNVEWFNTTIATSDGFYYNNNVEFGDDNWNISVNCTYGGYDDSNWTLTETEKATYTLHLLIPTGGPAWPSTWTLLITDPDDGVTSATEILGLWYNSDDSTYMFYRIELEADANGLLGTHTYSVYIDTNPGGDGTFDYEVHNYDGGNMYIHKWDDPNANEWNAENSDTISDSDGDGAMRTYSTGGYFVDFAILKSDIGGGSPLVVIAATKASTINIDLDTGPTTDNYPGITASDDPQWTDVTWIPEYPTELIPLATMFMVFAICYGRRKNKKITS